MPQKRTPTIVRYLSKVSNSGQPDECWPWTGAKDQDGYGIFWDGTYKPNGRGNYVRVTRWTYQQFVGPIPDGKQLLHSCDNPPCVNPSHLSAGTSAENHADREAKGRGRRQHGVDHPGSKLSEDDVRAIRAAHAAKALTYPAMAQKFGVSEGLIWKIVARRGWTHIE